MAEIRVEPKKQSSSSWIWILVVVLLAAALVYYFMTRNKTGENDTTPAADTTGRVYHPSPVRNVQDQLLPALSVYSC
jgi:flagellar basal body-associated protein FliL